MCIQYEVCDTGTLDVCGRDVHTELNLSSTRAVISWGRCVGGQS